MTRTARAYQNPAAMLRNSGAPSISHVGSDKRFHVESSALLMSASGRGCVKTLSDARVLRRGLGSHAVAELCDPLHRLRIAVAFGLLDRITFVSH